MKKLLSMFLACVLLLGILPTSAWAADSVEAALGQIPQDPGYSIHQVSCESCGASFDAMKIRHCPYCKREYDMRDHAWTVMKIQKTGGKTS